MLINSNLVIEGSKVVLVPYRVEHVERYNQWMQDPYLREATASEMLTLEEEYSMQVSWREDPDKITFILLNKDHTTENRHVNDVGRMIGDVNCYLNDPEDRHVGEIEVMIAEESSRGKGLAKEALTLFIAYLFSFVHIKKLYAKILEWNETSIMLFTKLGFSEISRSSVFKEVTMELDLLSKDRHALNFEMMASQLEIHDYDARE